MPRIRNICDLGGMSRIKNMCVLGVWEQGVWCGKKISVVVDGGVDVLCMWGLVVCKCGGYECGMNVL